MKNLDEQEIKIIKELIKDPRISDNQLGKNTKVPIKTVNRKRKLLEQEGIIRYYVSVNMGRKGTGRFGARQLHIIKFKLGITREQIINEFMQEKKVKTVFTDYIYASFLAEIEGHVAYVMIIEGKSDEDIVEVFNKEIIQSLRKNHGEDSIVSISTIRLSEPVRLFHNYLPFMNMDSGKIKKDWSTDFIFVE